LAARSGAADLGMTRTTPGGAWCLAVRGKPSPTSLAPTVHGPPLLLLQVGPGYRVRDVSGQEPDMKTSSVAVLAWTGSWADADVDAALLRHHATPRG
jgi:hypothetical protein